MYINKIIDNTIQEISWISSLHRDILLIFQYRPPSTNNSNCQNTYIVAKLIIHIWEYSYVIFGISIFISNDTIVSPVCTTC